VLPLSKKQVEEKVFEAIERAVPLMPSEKVLTTNFKQIGLDSLSMLDIQMELDDEFGREIPMDAKLETVQDVVDFYSK
jgi:acyl carrier protein